MTSITATPYAAQRRGILERFRAWAEVSERRFALRLLSEEERRLKGISDELAELEGRRPFWDVPKSRRT